MCLQNKYFCELKENCPPNFTITLSYWVNIMIYLLYQNSGKFRIVTQFLNIRYQIESLQYFTIKKEIEM